MTVTVNDRSYRLPRRPVAVICFDGCDPSYLADAAVRGIAPRLTAIARDGFGAPALSAMPSFTNPNNVSIVCGAPPAFHGVAGNYWYDRDTGQDVMMTDVGPLVAPTILAELDRAGVPTGAITAKDKLRRVLGHGLVRAGGCGFAFSAERADRAAIEENGIAAAEAQAGQAIPDQYSPDLSLFVLDAGIRLLAARRARVLYLSLSDFVQHAHAPGAPESDDFLRAVDARVGALIDAGTVVGIVADHGMTDLSLADGRPNVIYLGELLDRRFGAGAMRVICPITDPFVRHHGALGGFVRVHILDGTDPLLVRDYIASTPGVQHALLRDEVCARFDLPREREGDVAVLAAKGVALGLHPEAHQLDQLAGHRLRSHGSLFERDVPFLVSHPVDPAWAVRAQARGLHNYDIFDAVLNGVPAEG